MCSEPHWIFHAVASEQTLAMYPEIPCGKKKVKVGQSVRRLEFPGESPYVASVGAKTLNVILGHHEKTRGKVLVTGQPFDRSSSSTEKMVLEEEEKEPQEKKESESMKDSIRSSISILKEQTKRR